MKSLPRTGVVPISLFLLAFSWSANAATGAADDPAPQSKSQSTATEITIPGPLRSFLRMAGVSQKISPEEVLPLFARNISAQGYEGGNRPTEFLVLLTRYVRQARELSALAPGGVLHVEKCEDAGPLLRVLGYRMRQECGERRTTLETSDPERAFITIDSGFPLPDLEQTLQGGGPFSYPFPATRVPVIFNESEWITPRKNGDPYDNRDVIDSLLHDSGLSRLYAALSKLDPDTREVLRQSLGVRKLVTYSAVLDFYGSHISVRNGRVLVPGGPKCEGAWHDLAGKNPNEPGEFVQALLTKDKGWLAAYFDVLSRLNQDQQAHFTKPEQLKTNYEALRADDPSQEATKGSFRPAPWLLMLATRLQFDANGQLLVPGNLEVWRDIVRQKGDSAAAKGVAKRANRLTDSDHLVQAMFALSRSKTDIGPLQIFLALCELDSRRDPQHRLAPETVRLLARRFVEFSNQYRTFSEFPELSDSSIKLFLDVAGSIDNISNHAIRGNALGTFQANVGMWQILARQGQISRGELDNSWQKVVKPFAGLKTSVQVFDAGRSSLGELFLAATGKTRGSQDEIIELLAGPLQTGADARRMHQELAGRIRLVLDSQRLVSLDTILALGDGLSDKAQGKAVGDWLLTLAGELREFEMPQPIFTSGERTEWAAGVYNNSHTESEMRTDLTKVIKSSSRPQLEEARGQLASFLRDTLVGLNYAYYEPPGAQALHNNPLFVRSHDFSAETVGGIKAVWQAPQMFGAGTPAGGGAHLVGSLADLPYVLAEVEQDFIAPANVQALIWRELVPGLLTSAVLPRWWDVSPNELHAVTLYQKTGEELLTASVVNAELRGKVLAILSERMTPKRLTLVEQTLQSGEVPQLLPKMMPADTFYLAAEFRRRYSSETVAWGSAGQELQTLTQQHPEQVSLDRLSQDFGVPHPTLAHTYARELLNVGPLPAFSGYSSRLLAESWDSSNLYWARLADETGRAPVMLNRMVPELTHRMVEKVFATDFEDWPALVRAMREAGEDFKQDKMAAVPTQGEGQQH